MAYIIQKRFGVVKTKPQLSFDFGSRLIDKELELERNCGVDTINSLVQLYTEAIEYYEYKKDPRYYDYQNRMHKMFLRQDVIQAIKLKTNSNPIKTMTMEERKQESNILKLDTAADSNEKILNHNSKSLNRIIDYQKLRNLEIAKKAALDFKSQDQDLQKRLDSRKKSMLTKSMDTIKLSNSSILQHSRTLKAVTEESGSDTSVHSFGGLIEADELCFDDELEKIMEKNFAEKSKKMAEVQVNYESQMKEYEGGGSLMEKIREKLREDMQETLNVIAEEYDQKRKEEISQLKIVQNNQII